MEITGVIKWVGQPKNGQSQQSGNAWKSQEFVIEETGSQYPKSYVLSVFNKDNLYPLLQVGSVVTASFDGAAHEYNGRWYNDLRCWNIVPAMQQGYAQQYGAPQPQYNAQPAPQYGAQPAAPQFGAQPTAPQYGAPQPPQPQAPQYGAQQMPFPPADNGAQPF